MRGLPTLAPTSSDLAHCARSLALGSKTFHAASRALPPSVRPAVTVLYAFCRLADDLVDDAPDAAVGVASVEAMLARIYAGTPEDHPVERGMVWLVHTHALPRDWFSLLVEGFAWDAQGHRYPDLTSVRSYAVRVAGTVGTLMTALLGVRDPRVLARANDLGVAMQLTNICRDVGEDARRGRLYLPEDALRAEGIDPQAFLADPAPSPGVARVVAGLLAEADRLYARADRGIPWLPARVRIAIGAARLIYRDIGRVIAQRGFDSVTGRAVVGPWRKVVLLLRAVSWRWRGRRALVDPILPEGRPLLAALSPEAMPMLEGQVAS